MPDIQIVNGGLSRDFDAPRVPQSRAVGDAPEDLRLRFPISLRIILKQLFPLALVLMSLLAFAVVINTGTLFSNYSLDFLHDLDLELSAFMFIVVIVLGARAAQSALYRYRLSFSLEEGYLKVSKGIVLRHTGIFPLSRITDVYCTRGLLDVLFGLHTVIICTPTPMSENFAQIPGLSSGTAEQLCKFLLSAVEDYQLHSDDVSRNVVALKRKGGQKRSSRRR